MTMGSQERKGHPYQVMTHKYIIPLVELAGCVPLLVPTCCGDEDLAQYLALADGVYLTGAGSNIDPAHYGQSNLTPDKGQDRDRDHFDLPLIRAAIDRRLPLFGICRGMQEINVALGGTIHQKLYAQPGLLDHRENPEAPVEVQYGPAHPVTVQAGSWLAERLGRQTFDVNSLHGQGIDQLAAGLRVLGSAPDGVIEAFDAPELSPFLLAVQWHPEWLAAQNPVSIALFEAFGDACRTQRAQR
ncbi:gamma-glutamyl-gamma-aminobutyrate hydrolase family protein [Pseudomonas sp. NPDC007930]|uniref:gamma-glutamyl-gamma-aminobutyrate hydrolase family protein n=1 Tax=Pseudomonas sp. NPDC007930 TaxID=3364417 RepID=UPI0036E89DE0